MYLLEYMDYSEMIMNYLVLMLTILTVIVVIIICVTMYKKIFTTVETYEANAGLLDKDNTLINSLARFDDEKTVTNSTKITTLSTTTDNNVNSSKDFETDIVKRLFDSMNDIDMENNVEFNMFINRTTDEDIHKVLKTKMQCSIPYDRIFINRLFSYETFTEENNYGRMNHIRMPIPLNASDYDTPLLDKPERELGKSGPLNYDNAECKSCNVNSTNYKHYDEEPIDKGVFYVRDNIHNDVTVIVNDNKPKRLIMRYILLIVDNYAHDNKHKISYTKIGKVMNSIPEGTLVNSIETTDIKESTYNKLQQLGSMIGNEHDSYLKTYNVRIPNNLTMFQMFYVDISYRVGNNHIEPYVYDVYPVYEVNDKLREIVPSNNDINEIFN